MQWPSDVQYELSCIWRKFVAEKRPTSSKDSRNYFLSVYINLEPRLNVDQNLITFGKLSSYSYNIHKLQISCLADVASVTNRFSLFVLRIPSDSRGNFLPQIGLQRQ